MKGGLCPESVTSFRQRLAGGLASGSKPLLKDKKRLVMLVTRKALPCNMQGETLLSKTLFQKRPIL